MPHQLTPVVFPDSPDKIGPSDTILSLGSCFSDNIGQRLAACRYDIVSNPLGVLFNAPSILASLREVDESRYGQREDIHFHYDVHSQLNALEKSALAANIDTAQQKLHRQLEKCDWLILTLGTSIVHELKSDGLIVANCHKMPKELFAKRMLSIAETYETLDKIKELVPAECRIIITVSPIRHTKEGLVQNQRSKSRLIEAANAFADKNKGVHYFPSYEIMMDELRDYRYYKADLIHPSDEAIDHIWRQFQSWGMDDQSVEKIKLAESINNSMQHKALLPESKGHQAFLASLRNKKEEFNRRYGGGYNL